MLPFSANHLPSCSASDTDTTGCDCVLVSKAELATLREDAVRLETIKAAVQDVQAKLDARKCNRWDCLTTAMRVIDVASMETTGKYLS